MTAVSKFMYADHKCLDKLWSNFLSKKNDGTKTEKIFQEFSKHLKFHIQLENDFLFPKFDNYMGFTENNGPTPVLIKDHEVIILLLNDVEKKFKYGKETEIKNSSLNLKKFLVTHRNRELDMEYPIWDNFISYDELKVAVTKIYKNDFDLFDHVKIIIEDNN